MENIRAPDVKEEAKQDYLSGMKYKELAEKYEVSINTIKSWVKRYGWAKEKNKKGAHKTKKRGAPYNNKNAVGNKGGGAPLGNKNAVGNKGGAPPKNKNAEKHGFFSKYLPDETLDIIKEIKEQDPIDILWENIQIQYAAIIRAQKIMFVKNKEDMTEHLKKHKVIKGMSFTEEKEWELQFAWDKYATFLNAQSRAMAELRSLIKSYNELVDKGLATKEQELRVKKLQLEIDKMAGDDTGQETEEWVKAIEKIAAKRRGKNG
jgi:uncharacterized protein YjcR